MSERYYHKTFNPVLGIGRELELMDRNYELIAIIPHTLYESIAVFIDHPAEDFYPEASDSQIAKQEAGRTPGLKERKPEAAKELE